MNRIAHECLRNYQKYSKDEQPVALYKWRYKNQIVELFSHLGSFFANIVEQGNVIRIEVHQISGLPKSSLSLNQLSSYFKECRICTTPFPTLQIRLKGLCGGVKSDDDEELAENPKTAESLRIIQPILKTNSLHDLIRGDNQEELIEQISTASADELNAVEEFINWKHLTTTWQPKGCTPFHEAICQKNMSALTLLLNHNEVDVNKKTSLDEIPPLHVALFSDNIEAFIVLAESPRIDVNQKYQRKGSPTSSNQTSTLLDEVILGGYQEAAVALLIREDLILTSAELHFYMRLAIEQRQNITLQALLERREMVVGDLDSQGFSPLYYAISSLNIEALDILINFGISQKEITSLKTNVIHETIMVLSRLYTKNEIWQTERLLKYFISESDPSLLNDADERGLTPLMQAVKSKRDYALELLVERTGVEVNKQNLSGETALHIAIKMNNQMAFERLLSIVGIDVNKADQEGWTPLDLAVNKRSFFKMLCDRIDIDFSGALRTRLHRAIVNGDQPALMTLLAMSDCQVNSVDYDGMSALETALINENLEAFRVLIDRPDIDLNTVKNHGNLIKQSDTPLLRAMRLENKEFFKILFRHPRIDLTHEIYSGGAILLNSAIEKNDLETLKGLLEDGRCDINQVVQERYHPCTPLILTIKKRRHEAFNALLLDKRIAINKADDSGKTPFIIAMEENNQHALTALLDREELELNELSRIKIVWDFHTDVEELTPLFFAIKNPSIMAGQIIQAAYIYVSEQDFDRAEATIKNPRHLALIERLLKRGDIDLKKTNTKGENALHLSIKWSNLAALKRLLAEKSVSVNSVDVNGNTPLHVACQERSGGAIKVLLKHPEIEVNTPNNDGWTPLDLVLEEKKLCALLLARDDIDIDASKTKIHRAILTNNNEELVRLLVISRDEINSYDIKGKTPLHRAIGSGNIVALHKLLEMPTIEINKPDNEKTWDFGSRSSIIKGYTPLMQAIECKNEQAIKILLAREDIDINSVGADGKTALDIAIGTYPEAIKLLIKKTALIVDFSKSERALYYAIVTENQDILASILADYETDPSRVNFDSALNLAVELNNTNAVRSLINYENFDFGINAKRHLICKVIKEEKLEILDVLLAHPFIRKYIHTEVDYRDSNPLCVAIQLKNKPIIDALLAIPEIDLNKSALPFFTAIVEDNQEALLALLSDSRLDFSAIEASHELLNAAIQTCNDAALEALLAKSSLDPNKASRFFCANDEDEDDGYYRIIPPLYAAITVDNIIALKLLLARQDIDVCIPYRISLEDSWGYSYTSNFLPLTYAIDKNNVAAVKALLEHQDIQINSEVLREALLNTNISILQLLTQNEHFQRLADKLQQPLLRHLQLQIDAQ